MGNIVSCSASAGSTNDASGTAKGFAPAPPISEEPRTFIEESIITTNPGTYEELHKKCKDLFPNPFEGLKLSVNKGLSNNFQVSHVLNLTTMTPGSYHFGSTYVGSQQFGPHEVYPILLGDIDNTGSLSAQVIHQFTKSLKSKLVVQTQKSTFGMIQADTDYRGKDFTATVTLGNIDILSESGVIVAHYLQRMSPNIDLGAELLYHYDQGQENTALSLAGRYTADKWTAALNMSPSSFHASYYHRGNENVQVGVDFESNSRVQDSSVSLGYQVEIPKANVTFRGLVDTNWTVGAVLEKRLQPLPFSLVFTGMLNHQKNICRFGFGLMIG